MCDYDFIYEAPDQPFEINNNSELDPIPEAGSIFLTPLKKKTLRQSRFEIMSEGGLDIALLVREVTYKYKPQEVTMVLSEARHDSVVFNWIKLLLWSKDNILIRTMDSEGNIVFDNEFLGCRLKEHFCEMKLCSWDIIEHTITVTYEHASMNKSWLHKE